MANKLIIDQLIEASPLSYAFVLEAVRRYTLEINKTKPEDYPERSIIDGKAWIFTSNEITKILDKL